MTDKPCKNCNKDSHHFLLCPKKKAKSNSNVAKNLPASSYIWHQAKLLVLMQAQYVSTIHCPKVGTFLDLGSRDNYVTHRFAKKHRLQGKDIDLEVEGISGKKSYVHSKIYTVPIRPEAVKEII